MLVPAVADESLAEERAGRPVSHGIKMPRRASPASGRIEPRTRAPACARRPWPSMFFMSDMFRKSRSVWYVNVIPKRVDLVLLSRPTRLRPQSGMLLPSGLSMPVTSKVEQRRLPGPVRPDHARRSRPVRRRG